MVLLKFKLSRAAGFKTPHSTCDAAHSVLIDSQSQTVQNPCHEIERFYERRNQHPRLFFEEDIEFQQIPAIEKIMANAKPQELANELILLMNTSNVFKAHIPELNLARIKRKFKEIENKVSPAVKLELRGMLATIECDIESVHSYHKAAIELDNSPIRYENYATSAARIGQRSLALSLYKKVYDNDNSNRKFLRLMIDELANVGRFEAANNYTSLLNPDEVEMLKTDINEIKDRSEFLYQLKIADSELALYAETVTELLQEKSIVAFDASIEPVNAESEEGDESFLEILIHIKESIENAIELGSSLCDKLAMKDLPEEFSSRVTVRFIPT